MSKAMKASIIATASIVCAVAALFAAANIPAVRDAIGDFELRCKGEEDWA